MRLTCYIGGTPDTSFYGSLAPPFTCTSSLESFIIGSLVCAFLSSLPLDSYKRELSLECQDAIMDDFYHYPNSQGEEIIILMNYTNQ
jgi:hypothetical protein